MCPIVRKAEGGWSEEPCSSPRRGLPESRLCSEGHAPDGASLLLSLSAPREEILALPAGSRPARFHRGHGARERGSLGPHGAHPLRPARHTEATRERTSPHGTGRPCPRSLTASLCTRNSRTPHPRDAGLHGRVGECFPPGRRRWRLPLSLTCPQASPLCLAAGDGCFSNLCPLAFTGLRNHQMLEV